MLGFRAFSILVRITTIGVCWVIVMGVPLLFFSPPLTAATIRPFLGVFYVLLLFTGTVVARTWGLMGAVVLALPFLLMFTLMGAQAAIAEAPFGLDGWQALWFWAIYGVVGLAARIGDRLPSPARERGQLL